MTCCMSRAAGESYNAYKQRLVTHQHALRAYLSGRPFWVSWRQGTYVRPENRPLYFIGRKAE